MFSLLFFQNLLDRAIIKKYILYKSWVIEQII